MKRRYALLTEVEGTVSSLVHTVVVPGRSQGGPPELTGAVVDHLITAEREGLHTVLLAPELSDLEAEPAQICRYVVTDDPEVAREAESRYGPERVLRSRTAHADHVDEWIGHLALPESRSWGRRVRNAARGLPFAGRVYARLTRSLAR